MRLASRHARQGAPSLSSHHNLTHALSENNAWLVSPVIFAQLTAFEYFHTGGCSFLEEVLLCEAATGVVPYSDRARNVALAHTVLDMSYNEADLAKAIASVGKRTQVALMNLVDREKINCEG